MKHGIGELRGDQALVRQYYTIVLQEAKQREMCPMEGLDTRDELAQECGEPIEDLILIPLENENKDHTTQIGSSLDYVSKDQLTSFLQMKANIFA